MGHRLSRITTRTGDGGETGLADGQRLTKDHPRVHALGEVDELNACIGLITAEALSGAVSAQLQWVQQRLFDLGGELCLPGQTLLAADTADQLEAWLEAMNAALPPLKEFILPGGNRACAATHLARTVARRAERCLVGLGHAESVTPGALSFINRLSDYLFVLARHLNADPATELSWSPPPRPR